MDICRSDEAATVKMKSITGSAEIHNIKKSHYGDTEIQNIQLGNLAIHGLAGQCRKDKTSHTGMVTLHERVNSVDELTHRRKTENV